VAKFTVRIAVNKNGLHRFHMGRFNLKTSNKVQVKGKYPVEVSHRFVALEDLGAEVNTYTAWETTTISKFQPKRV
jgi:hypothetical protein